MRISVRAKPNAKIEKVEQTGETDFSVSVKAPPKEGKANKAIQKALADYFEIPASQVFLVSGFTAKKKIFDILLP